MLARRAVIDCITLATTIAELGRITAEAQSRRLDHLASLPIFRYESAVGIDLRGIGRNLAGFDRA